MTIYNAEQNSELSSCLRDYSFLGIAYDRAHSHCHLMAEREPSPALLTAFFIRPCGCQIVVEAQTETGENGEGSREGREEEGKRKGWGRTLSMLFSSISPVLRTVPTT